METREFLPGGQDPLKDSFVFINRATTASGRRVVSVIPSPLVLRGRLPGMSGTHGPHGPDIPAAPRVDPERLDGLPPGAAGEGPRGVRPPAEQIEAARERRELLRPHRSVDPRDPVDPRRDGAGDRGIETGTFFRDRGIRAHVIIREAKDTDRAALERIARESFTGAYALFAVRGLRRAKPLLVAEEEGSL